MRHHAPKKEGFSDRLQGLRTHRSAEKRAVAVSLIWQDHYATFNKTILPDIGSSVSFSRQFPLYKQ